MKAADVMSRPVVSVEPSTTVRAASVLLGDRGFSALPVSATPAEMTQTMLANRLRCLPIVEVRNENGSPPYVVRWLDSDHEALVFPGPDAHVVTAESAAG